MLVAYYSRGCDSLELFTGRKAEEGKLFKKHLNQHNVIRLDIQKFLESQRDLDTFISEIERTVVRELMETFPECKDLESGGRLKFTLDNIFVQTGQGFVFVIDEWDCVFRVAKDRKEIQKDYLDFLRGLFKSSNYVELAYMTGILPIKKYGEHSAINIFKEFSMLNPGRIGQCFGFTEQEVKSLCEQHGIDYRQAQRWYDGYRLGSASCKIDPSTFQNDMTTFKSKDDVLTLLVHLGYLTFDKKESMVSIPNQEIAQEFIRAIKTGGWDGHVQALNQSEKILLDTWNMNGEGVARGISAIHNETASVIKYNDENSLTCMVLMAYYSAKAYYMNPLMELPSGKGFANVAYLPRRNGDRPALLVELKWNKSAKGAICQIKERQYADWIEGYVGDILLVAISYDKKKKIHECVIEKFIKE